MHSVAAIAHHWGVSGSLIRKLVKNGELAHHRIGRRVLISGADANVYMIERRYEAKPLTAPRSLPESYRR